VRRRGTARFGLAVVAMFAVYEGTLAPTLRLGYAALGGWGLVAAVVVLGFGLALLFTAIYDGPVAVGRLLIRDGGKKRSPSSGPQR
jgi:hypothetical protein